jgi:hypothetical protein
MADTVERLDGGNRSPNREYRMGSTPPSTAPRAARRNSIWYTLVTKAFRAAGDRWEMKRDGRGQAKTGLWRSEWHAEAWFRKFFTQEREHAN